MGNRHILKFMEDNNYLELKAFQIWLGVDSIIRTVVKKISGVSLKETDKNIMAIPKISNIRALPLLLDLTKLYLIILNASKTFATCAKSIICAIAILSRSTIGKDVGNFYLPLDISNNTRPTKLFISEEEVLDWSKTFFL